MLHETTPALPPIVATLFELEFSEFNFYLTGSRFFGGISNTSDWDFVTENNDKIENYLVSIGFKENVNLNYLDPMTEKVYTKYFCGCENNHASECLKIDIQICNDIFTKIKIRDILKNNFTDGIPGDKYDKSRIWGLVYNLIKNY